MEATGKAKALTADRNGRIAYVHSKCRRNDGTFDSYRTQSVPVRVSGSPRSGATVCGYGVAQPTPYEVLFNGRWRRVRLAKGRRTSTAYIGRKLDECLIVSIVAG
jgi:hypothetical protein